ncbi:unnamed protein product [Sympodiomycopsis kandeliae]
MSPPPELPASITGHCYCKRTAYTVRLTNLSSDLRLSAYCHCSNCQRLNGAPFIWTTHWAEDAVAWSSSTDSQVVEKGEAEVRTKGGARLIPSEEENPVIPDVEYAPTMAVFETMPMRKWKQRCDHCGTPLGSWNSVKRQWSLWPPTLSRDYTDATHPPPEGAIHPTVFAAIAADHHQFYGPWRTMDVPDKLDKFVGYRYQGEKVT